MLNTAGGSGPMKEKVRRALIFFVKYFLLGYRLNCIRMCCKSILGNSAQYHFIDDVFYFYKLL